MKKIETVAIVGMGALGILYADHITRHGGRVQFVMDEKRFEKYKDASVYCNGEERRFPCLPAGQAKPVDLLIVAVKSTGLAQALDVMEGCVGEDTVIVSVMNGITSEETIGGRYGHEKLIYTVAQGMDAMRFDNRLTYTKTGWLRIGAREEFQKENLERVCEYFDRIELEYKKEEDIMLALWGKFMVNVGVNQVCMVFNCPYLPVWQEGTRERETMLGAMREVVAIANAEGLPLSEEDVMAYDAVTKTMAPDATPSMGQDRIAKRYSEVETFAGTVIAYGEKHGIPTPINRWLYSQVKQIESGY